MMHYTWDLYRFKLTNLSGDKWYEYIAADDALSAFGYIWESLNSEEEFIEQMEYIDEVHFKIEEKEARTSRERIEGLKSKKGQIMETNKYDDFWFWFGIVCLIIFIISSLGISIILILFGFGLIP